MSGGHFPLTLSARSVPVDPVLRASAAKAAGFMGIGITLREFTDAQGANRGDELLARIGDTGIRITEIEFLHLWLHPDDPVSRQDEDTADELAAKLGLRYVTAGLVEPSQTDPDLVESFVALCSRLTVGVALEFMPFGPVKNLQVAREMVAAAGDYDARLVLDSWHWLTAQRAGLQVPVDKSLPLDLISHVQLAGLGPNGRNTRVESLTQRQPPDHSDTELVDFVTGLDGAGYRGPYSCEVIRNDIDAQQVPGFVRECATGCFQLLELLR